MKIVLKKIRTFEIKWFWFEEFSEYFYKWAKQFASVEMIG